MTSSSLLQIVHASSYEPPRSRALDPDTLSGAAEIIADIRHAGWEGVRRWSLKLGERAINDPLVLNREELRRAWERISHREREVLQAVCSRIQRFAAAQRSSMNDVELDVPGGRAGHRWVPIQRVGCYIPGGRYPLPSTALMTVATARAAGCQMVLAASPHPGDLIQAAVYLAGGDALLCVGGAHAVAVMAFGATGDQETHAVLETPCDLIVGPGNRWVTAAKKLVFGDVGIDMLAGPSELVVVADESADAQVIAADLLAQAEHDTDASAILVTTSLRLIELTREALERQLGDLPTAGTAREALRNSAAILCDHWDQAVAVVESIAPEHLELHGSAVVELKHRFTRAGCVFVGSYSAEVFGDYGIGPNHTLPTNRTARFASGLSVLTFCRLTTWVELNEAPPSDLIRDTSALAHWEGLEAHARAALRRQLEPDSE